MYRKNLLLIFLGIIAIRFALYGSSIGGDFIYDDTYFSDRTELKSSEHLTQIWLEPYLPDNPDAGSYRPFAVFSFSTNYIIFGSSPVIFHIINIILNALVIYLIFLLVYRLFNNRNLALFSAIFFAFLPIHTEAVAF